MAKNWRDRQINLRTKDASGVTGFLLRPILSKDDWYFRVYLPTRNWYGGRKFIDYRIEHFDLQVTISEGELATFYSDGRHHWLDYPPRDE
jgi:hypothetical protein